MLKTSSKAEDSASHVIAQSALLIIVWPHNVFDLLIYYLTVLDILLRLRWEIMLINSSACYMISGQIIVSFEKCTVLVCAFCLLLSVSLLLCNLSLPCRLFVTMVDSFLEALIEVQFVAFPGHF